MSREPVTTAGTVAAAVADPGQNGVRPTSPGETIDVHLERVTKRFGDLAAVDDLTLDISSGEFFSLLGPSGCGKTTTLRMIGGFEDPTAGQIFLGGQDVTLRPPYKRDVNTVFQSYALFPHLDVAENVAFGLKRKKVPKREIERRVDEMLALVDLPQHRMRKAGQLSGGQQQRVALARALVNHPKLLLLDEPMSALDAKLRKQMQIELKRIQTEVGITFLYVTHDQEEAMTMSDRLAVMRDGRIEDLGSPERVYERPATEFVASFLGASNLLAGTLGDHDASVASVEVEGGAVMTVPSDFVTGRSRGARVKVGVRPEKIHIQVTGEDPDAGWNHLRARVRVSTFTGVGNQYLVDTPLGTELTVYAQNLGAATAPRSGEEVLLTWRPEHTFVVEPSDTPVQNEEEQ